MRIGDSNILITPNEVWTNGKPYSGLRQSERLLFSRIDLLVSYLNAMSEDDPNWNTVNNLLTLYYIELRLVNEFSETDEYLYRAGVSLSQYLELIMSQKFTSENERNAFILNILDDIKKRTINGSSQMANVNFMSDWVRDVYDQNFFIDFATGAECMNAPSSHIGELSSDELQNEFKKVAGNLVYTVVPSATITTAEAKRKRVLQNAVISGLCGSGYGFTSQICNNYIISSIVTRSGISPEEYVECMKQIAKNDQQAKIGDFGILELVASIVTALITAGTAVFTAVYNSRKNNPSYRNVVSSLGQAQDSYAETSDWWRLGDITGDGKDDTFTVWGIVLALFGFAYLYKK